MQNLFSIFDPNVIWLNLRLNWIASLILIIWIPSIYWLCKSKRVFLILMLTKTLEKEFKLNFGMIYRPGHTHWAIGLFLIILINNVIGLTPYTFTSTSHLSFSIRIAFSIWLGYIIYGIFINIGRFLAHLVPLGTPYILIPFIVLIELVRNLIRPITLSVRLAANLVAGHLLITLVRSPIVSRNYFIFIVLILVTYALLILESAVAFIQAYVFRMLRTLYLREVNYQKFNY